MSYARVRPAEEAIVTPLRRSRFGAILFAAGGVFGLLSLLMPGPTVEAGVPKLSVPIITLEAA